MKKIIYMMLVISTFSINAQQQYNVPFRVADMYVYETVTDGVGTFNLTSQSQYLNNTLQYNTLIISFYTNYLDAQNATNAISNASSYVAYIFQQIFIRAQDGNTGYFYVVSFNLYVQNDAIINIPDENFKSILLAANPSVFSSDNGGVIDQNHDGEIQLSEANHIQTLNLALATTTLDISDLTGIQAFNNLTDLDLSDNQFTSFNQSCLNGLIKLKKIYASHCNISALSVNNLTNLRELEIQNNSITTIDVSSLTNLYSFAPATNPLTSLNINNLVNLINLKCYSDTLTNLDLSYFPKLTLLQCSDNQLTTLDVSHNPELYFLECRINNLTELNLKNGRIESTLDFSNNPNLAFICVDEEQTTAIQNQLNGLGMNATVSHTYCSFTPGGNYNTITGTVTFDANNNGCDSNDITQPNIRVDITGTPNAGANFTENNADYTFYTLAGSFTIIPAVENLSWFNVSPASAVITFPDANNNTATQNFCIAANGTHPDLEVVIAPITPARPGFDAVYKVVYKNKGNQTLSGNVIFNYDDSVLDFVSSDVVPTTQSTGLLSYDYTNLLPFENRSFNITLHVNAPTDTPAVNISDPLTFTATVNPVAGDEIPSDNTFQYHQMVVGAFDPNEITCIEGNLVSPSEIGNYLHYVINFENTGTADAQNIVVKDIIDTTQFDVSSLQLLNSSTPVTARLNGNIAEFIFQNVNLHSGGHGNILIKVKSKNTLVQGDTVSKKASIFFDYNAPVDTNLENTTFQALSSSNYNTDATISVNPNPTKGNVNINCKNNIQSVQLYDIQGRILQTNLVNETQTSIDISNQATGVYFVKVLSDKGSKVEKIVKE